ncbi:MAG: Fpg/Nei family DNA glycosylase [Chloroflexi bacterium]|nr:Fpg/Nei family DNA glycosylase [Chloroflexota bacterium]MBV9599405.1 Fpg/Nei family DNA glycosylase [Chloroflexota bacterium]
MPEGDTIFQTAAALRPLLVGQHILGARARTPGPQIQRVVGARVVSVEPVGKHLLIRFDNGLTLHTHLRMGGTWHRYAPGERWRMADWKARVVLEVAEHVLVCFNAPVAELMENRAVALHPALRSLGPDLLSPSFSSAESLRRLRSQPDAEIAEALLDQRVMAGVGNVFKSETLFIESVNPWTRVAVLDDSRLEAIIATAHRLLLDNATPGRPHRVTTRGDPAARGSSYVYGRANEPCPHCGTPIRVRRQGALNRPTYWCPNCQPADGAAPPTSPTARELPRTADR